MSKGDLDPAKLLPFSKRLIPEDEDDEDVEMLPKDFSGRLGEGIFDEQPRYGDA